jgi:hypothetical protein
MRFGLKHHGQLSCIEHCPEGEYVLHSDYARLKAQVERLTKAGDAFENEFDYLTESMRMLDNEKALLKKLFSKWKSAKKSTQ